MSTSNELKRRVLASYRALLRAERFTFKGDTYRIADVQKYTRNIFEQRKGIIDLKEIEGAITDAENSATFIVRNIVQAVKKPTPDRQDIYELRITPMTELGDNDNVKKPSARGQSQTQSKCCGSGNANAS
ncbi:hypothetical protein BJ742DRAFT_828250 [Cladochytrium replicatum]|nr:hypothetical protein BJ742DRAFT_828250 [Cladochytrium replicatum]